MANSPKITVNGFKFSWAGGAYIDITAPGQSAPFDVINDEASETDDEGTYLHPERRRALDVAWLMIVEASANKQARAIHPMGCLNADLAHNRDMA